MSKKSQPKLRKKVIIVASIVILLLAIITTVIILLSSANNSSKYNISLKVPSKTIPFDKTFIRAVSANNPNHELYQAEIVKIERANGEETDIRWRIPDAYKSQSTLVEIVNHYGGYSTCAYYVPANSAGFFADILGWSKLDGDQSVKCSDNSDSQGASSSALE